MSNAQPEILVIEDNADFVRLIQEAFRQENLSCRLNTAEDGVKALDYLYARPPFEKRVLPQLIFLDIRMPRKDGLEVLKEIKADPNLKFIPVIVMSTSYSEKDLLASYDSYASCFIVRPMLFQDLRKLVQSVYNFWFRTATLPN